MPNSSVVVMLRKLFNSKSSVPKFVSALIARVVVCFPVGVTSIELVRIWSLKYDHLLEHVQDALDLAYGFPELFHVVWLHPDNDLPVRAGGVRKITQVSEVGQSKLNSTL